MNPIYSISKPCSEDWSKMTSEEQGRHCQVCCKTVVDFSQKTDSEIVGFLKTNSQNKICGRFRTEQLIPTPRVPRPKSRYRTFFAALLFVFGGMLFSSCAGNHDNDPKLMGDVAYMPDTIHPKNEMDSAAMKRNKIVDTLKKNIPDTLKKSGMNEKKHPHKGTITTLPIPEHMMGEVAYIPDTIKTDSLK